MTGRKILGIIFFSIFFLVLGHNLSFLPDFKEKPKDLHNTVLEDKVKKVISKQNGFYSVYYKNLKTGQYFGINEDKIEKTASVNKVPIIAALYYMAHKGELSLDDHVTIQKNDIQDYGTGSLRYQDNAGSYSLKNLARLSLQNSDNTAAHVIGVRIDLDKVQSIVNSWGMKQTLIGSDESSTHDIGMLFEKIYKRQIADEAHTKELLSFMTDTDFEDRLPASLPKTVKVYHKTGEGIGAIDDVGIIEDQDNVYYLGVMTSDVGDHEDETRKIIAEISKIVYDGQN